jgi:hypothetical protein
MTENKEKDTQLCALCAYCYTPAVYRDGFVYTCEDHHLHALKPEADLTTIYEVCPECEHDWIAHFGMIDPTTKELTNPYPVECVEGCGCTLAIRMESDQIRR